MLRVGLHWHQNELYTLHKCVYLYFFLYIYFVPNFLSLCKSKLANKRSTIAENKNRIYVYAKQKQVTKDEQQTDQAATLSFSASGYLNSFKTPDLFAVETNLQARKL